MIREFEILTDVISQKTNKIIRQDVLQKKTFDTDLISVEEYIDLKGKKIAKYCYITDETKYYKVNLPYKDVVALIKPVEVIGLIGKSKRYKNGRMV